MSDDTIIDDAAKRMTDTAMEVYKEHKERAALRCATGDAASLCDAVIRFIGTQNRTKHGRISKHGQELQAIAKLCGDEIWKMRDRIGFD